MLNLLAPLSLVRGGQYAYSNGTLYRQSSNGFYWLWRLINTMDGSYLNFNSGSVNPPNYRERGFGLSLRCLALEK